MEASNCEINNSDNIYKDAAKAIKICELILDIINLDQINALQLETQELNNMNLDQFIEYVKIVGIKEDDTEGKIDPFTYNFKNAISCLIIDIEYELNKFNKIVTYDILYKLSCYYYLFKIITSNDKDEEDHYILQIDLIVEKIVLYKDYYYKILIHLGLLEEGVIEQNKNEKIDAYFKILFFLNEKMLSEELSKFINDKKKSFKQYNITLPPLSFSIQGLRENLKLIYNILYILKETENFKTLERFEYFNFFKNKNELLEGINYILVKLNKKPILSLDKSTDDIAEEAINYSFKNSETISNNDKYISELEQIVANAEKKQKEYKQQKQKLEKEYKQETQRLKEKIQQYETKTKEFNDKYIALNNSYTKDLNELKSKISSLKKQQAESNEKKNKQASEITSLKNDVEKNKEIIERISYREIGSKIIQFFSLSQSENKRKEYMQNHISPTNISVIIAYLKDNLSNYYEFMKKEGIDLSHILKEIKIEKKSYDSFVHDRQRELKTYIELMNKRNKSLGEKITFIFNNSKLMHDYVFKNDNQIKEKEIFDEFKQKEEDLKKKNEKSNKNAEKP